MGAPSNAITDDDRRAVAVIGLSCRFPGEASNPEAFWQMLSKGRSASSKIPQDRFNANAFHDGPSGGLNRSITDSGHFLQEDIRRWDASFFGITPGEAEAMDPQQRLMMEVAFEAFENAGITPRELSGSNTGCWMGANSNDWRETMFRDPEAAPMHTWTGTGPEYISGRVSWFYNLRGPSMTVNTACSSSLVALHQAVQSIQCGECDVAIVGGANLIFNPEYYLFYSNQKFLSADGKCKSFDSSGDGFGRGEGLGAVILKRFTNAVQAGDNIRSIIRGTAVGQDGWTSGITLPNADAQAELIQRTYAAAGIPATETRYVEAHGTGTKVGDPAELEAIYKTLGGGPRPTLIGSVKTNIGHLEGAAGIAGVIKGILMLEHGRIPPTIGIKALNPKVDWEKWRLQVVDDLQPWLDTGPRRVSVSSFGASGTIAHAILEAPSASMTEPKALPASSHPKLIILSANDPATLQRQKANLCKFLEKLSTPSSDYFERLALTLTTKRAHFDYRSCLVSPSTELLRDALEAGNIPVHQASAGSPRLGFVFTGQGAQWARMGIELLAYPVFRRSIERADKYLKTALDCTWSALQELSLDADHSHINQAEYSQPLCTVLQVALVDLLESWNITPTAVVGHSSGEIAAAYCLGALSAEEAWTAAYWRGNVKSRSAIPRGAMLAAGISPDQAATFIAKLTKGMAVVGCVNAPTSVTLSGDETAIAELSELLTTAGHFNRRLKVDTAYHSLHLSCISNEYLMRLRHVRPKPARPGRTMHSSVTGQPAAAATLGPSNWVRNLVSPVLFATAVESMMRSKEVDVLLEVGPHAALAAPVKTTMTICGIDKEYLSVLSRGSDAVKTAMGAAADLLARGARVDVKMVNREDDGNVRMPLADLPAYSWNHETSYWAQSRWDREYCHRPHPAYRFVGAPMPQLVANENIWRAFIRASEEHWVLDHKIQGVSVYPAMGYVAMAIEAARQLASAGRTIQAFRFRDVRFLSAAEMSESAATEMTLSVRPAFDDDSWLSFSISSCSKGAAMKCNCTGRFRIDYVHDEPDAPAAQELAAVQEDIRHRYQKAKQACRRPATGAFYAELARMGLEIGPAFQNMTDIHVGNGQSCCIVNVCNPAGERDQPGQRPFIIHPATLEPITQSISAAAGLDSRTPIPTAIEEMLISANIPFEEGKKLAAFSNTKHAGPQSFLSDIYALESSSLEPVLSLTGLRLTRIPGQEQTHNGNSYHMCSQIVTKPSIELLKPHDLSHVLSLGRKDSPLLFQLLEFVDILYHNNPEISISEVGDKSILNNDDDQRRHKPVSQLVSWKEDQLCSASSSLDAGASFDAIVLTETVVHETSLSTLIETVIKRLEPSGFICAVGPGTELDAALHKHGAHVHARLPSPRQSTGNDDQTTTDLVIASMQGGWASPFSASDIVILEPETSSHISTALAEQLEQHLASQRYRPVRVQWPATALYEPLIKRARCVSLIEVEQPLITAINEPDFQELQRLFAISRDILWVTAGDDPSFQAIDGMVRTIRNEDASISIRTLHLQSQKGADAAETIGKVATQNTRDNEFSVDEHGIVQTIRIVPDPVLSDRVSGQHVSVRENLPLGHDGIAKRLEIGEIGHPESLHFVEDPAITADLGADEVLLRVTYSGLNFKDIMIAMGRVAGTIAGAEGSGTVLRVGKAVVNLKPGDPVLCLSVGLHSSIARVKASLCRALPPSLQLADAASLPVVHCTAYNTFVRIARPEPGQSVLIHAGAGGLGQVAIQYAQHFGMEIFVTVGSTAKRDLIKELYALPDDHILNSREPSFAMAIKRMTSGRGVDVILNSLSGDMLRESWRVLAPGGTFVEVGKAVLEHARPPSEVGATYSTFDVEHIVQSNPKLASQLLDGAMDFVRRGITRPVKPLTEFPVSKVSDAVRLMQSGQHMGKLLLSWGSDDVVPVLGDGGASARLRSNATYVLIGGLGGIGRSLAGMLIELGARNICFLSRSGAKSSSAQALLADLASDQVNCRAYACDVANESQLQGALAQCAIEMPPVAGVLQCAAVFRDATFANQNLTSWQEAIRPKIQASWNIHNLLPKDLDFFVLLSSFAGLFGNLGQASYGAGSSYQDSLAHFRRAQGLRATSLDLGIINDVGVLAETGMTENLQAWSCFGIGEVQLQNLIRTVIQDQVSGNCILPPQVPTGIASRGAALAAGIEPPFYLQDPRFSVLNHTGQQVDDKNGASAGPSFSKRLSAAKSADQAEGVMTDMLVHKVAKCLGVNEDRIDTNRSLPAYGINSLVAIEIRNWIFKEGKVEVTIFDLISPLPIKSLVEKIVQSMSLS